MLANALRTHARIFLVSSRIRLPSVSQLHRSVINQPLRSSIYTSLFSTHSCRQQGDFMEALPSFRRSIPPSSTVWIGNLPYSSDESELRDLFGTFGELRQVRIGQMADGRSRGFAHIEFASIADATSVVEASKTSSFKILDRELKVDYAPPRFQHTPEPYHVLYVSEFVGNEEELRSAMKDYGSSITKVTLMKNPLTGESVGAGFVEFIGVERASEALHALNGTDYAYGTKLKLAYARSRRERRNRQQPGLDGNGRSSRRGGGYGFGGEGSS